jgi:D-3-phosphoglycerate dehydrogenase / 2-oxoglutarate reductase
MKILVTDGMSRDGIETLRSLDYEITEQHFEPDELKKAIRGFDAVIVRSATKITKEVIDGALETKKLKLVIRAGVGIDNIDVDYAQQSGIIVRNTPCSSSRSVAELAVGHMFTIARYMHNANRTMCEGKWEKKKYVGVELFGKTLGVIGLGRIGRETAKIGKAIGMNVIYNSRSGAKMGAEDFEYVSMRELLKRSDFITLHIPYVKENGATLGAKEFGMMKDGVRIVNTARGGLIDEQVLLDALETGKVAAAAMDVFCSEPKVDERILNHDSISVTPHIAGFTKEAQTKIGQEIVEIVQENLMPHSILAS